MRAKLIIGSFAIGALISAGGALAQSTGTQQSQKTGKADQSGTPNPEGSRYGSGSGETSRSGEMSRSRGAASGSAQTGTEASSQAGSQQVKEVQQALKEKGHDPGPIDGIMGARTKEALRKFQMESNIEATGTLNAETAQKLGVDASAARSPGASGSGASRGTSEREPETGSREPGKSSGQSNRAPMQNR